MNDRTLIEDLRTWADHGHDAAPDNVYPKARIRRLLNDAANRLERLSGEVPCERTESKDDQESGLSNDEVNLLVGGDILHDRDFLYPYRFVIEIGLRPNVKFALGCQECPYYAFFPDDWSRFIPMQSTLARLRPNRETLRESLEIWARNAVLVSSEHAELLAILDRFPEDK